MKFRNPETGEVFDDVDVTLDSAFDCDCCNPGTCPVGKAAFISGYSCCDYVEKHPHEAACLMGFEVVEDEQFREVTKMMKEANMDKPRICDVLGVNVDEEFEFDFDSNQVSRGTMKIGADGLRYYKDKKDWFQCWNEEDLIYIINHPDRIIRKPRFTQQEVESAKIISVLFPEATHIERLRGSKVLGITGAEDGWIADIESSLFPEIKSGQSVTLDQIIGGAE